MSLRKNGYDIFLGGTKDSTWRNEFNQLLSVINTNLKCFNPIVPNWTKECIDLENFVKAHVTYHVYVITPRHAGYYSIAEMVESAHMHGKKVFFLIQEEDIDESGNLLKWQLSPRNSLTAVGNLLKSHGAIEAKDMSDLVSKISDDFNGTPKPRTVFEKNKL